MSPEQRADARREASAKCAPVVFDELKPGDRIHLNSGWRRTSWTAEVRSAPIDGQVVVILRAAVNRDGRAGSKRRYEVLDVLSCLVWSRPGGMLWKGPIPKLEWDES